MNLFDLKSEDRANLIKKDIIYKLYGSVADHVVKGSNIDILLTHLSNQLSQSMPNVIDYMDIDNMSIDNLIVIANRYGITIEKDIYAYIKINTYGKTTIKKDSLTVTTITDDVIFVLENDIEIDNSFNTAIVKMKLLNNFSGESILNVGELRKFNYILGDIVSVTNLQPVELETDLRKKYITKIKDTLLKESLSDSERIEKYIKDNLYINKSTIENVYGKLVINIWLSIYSIEKMSINVYGDDALINYYILDSFIAPKNGNIYDKDIYLSDGVILSNGRLSANSVTGTATIGVIRGFRDLFRYIANETNYGYNVEINPIFLLSAYGTFFVKSTESIDDAKIKKVSNIISAYFKDNVITNKNILLGIIRESVPSIIDIGNYYEHNNISYGNVYIDKIIFDDIKETDSISLEVVSNGKVPIVNDSSAILNYDFGDRISINMSPEVICITEGDVF